MKTIMIREHKHGSVEMIHGVPDHVAAGSLVDAWCRKTIHYQVHGTLPAITWKVAESNDPVACLIESSRL